MVPPRPSPIPLPHAFYNVGVDLCKIPRIMAYITGDIAKGRDGRLLPWLARSFHTHELSWLMTWLRARHRMPANTRREVFAALLAGRWAAKEAAIKAHSKRSLFPRDVWIRARMTGAPECLIAPAARRVQLSREVAALRGLGQAQSSEGALPREDINLIPEETRVDRAYVGIPAARPPTDRGRDVFYRWYDAPVAAFQSANLSISHDGDYAIAVVQALDQDVAEEPPDLVDDGEHAPIHVPARGDKGCPAILYGGLLRELLTHEGEKMPPGQLGRALGRRTTARAAARQQVPVVGEEVKDETGLGSVVDDDVRGEKPGGPAPDAGAKLRELSEKMLRNQK